MKRILYLSLILNVICLGKLFFSSRVSTPHSVPADLEIKESKSRTLEKPSLPCHNLESLKSLDSKEDTPISIDEVEFRADQEKVELDKREYLIQELGLEEVHLDKAAKLKRHFISESNAIHEKAKRSHTGELSFSEQRKLIDLEEKLHQDLAALYGKERWSRFLKFREKFNGEVIKKLKQENGPVIFMGI